ncbi:hypothetical protein BASA81_015639 [Batrachochytrium salamandrivorans]|nr:hypothetical protein BASA81_015639 [Batrachochytrium salamandrivorans]
MELPFEIIRIAASLSWLKESTCLKRRKQDPTLGNDSLSSSDQLGWLKGCMLCLVHGLTTLVHGKRDRWDEYLPQVLLALRTRTHAVTGFSPFFLLFGIHPRLPTDETPPRNTLAPLDEIERMEENSEFIARNLEEVGQARSAANVRTKAQSEAMRKRGGFDENTPDYFFKVGDMVKMKHHERLKLEFRWKGPYHVVDVGHPGTIGS